MVPLKTQKFTFAVLVCMQVVDTCVRNGYYEEALDLCSHVRHMERKHGCLPIVKVYGLY